MFTHGSGKYSKLEGRRGEDGGGGGGGPDDIGPINFGGTPRPVSRNNEGGGPSSIIPTGLPFAGRTEGGGNRSQIYGTKTYGSGYGSNFSTRGVNGRPFPFYFWPVVWGEGALPSTSANLNASAEVVDVSAGAYLNARAEYGDVDNSMRPGGPLFTASYADYNDSWFRVVADQATVASIIAGSWDICPDIHLFHPEPIPLNPNASSPRPEQVIQYYRASSIAFTMDGYNNSATYAPEGTPDSPLPPLSPLKQGVLDCLNLTIGQNAPLVDNGQLPVDNGHPLVDNGQPALWAPSHVNLVGLVWVLWAFLGFIRL